MVYKTILFFEFYEGFRFVIWSLLRTFNITKNHRILTTYIERFGVTDICDFWVNNLFLLDTLRRRLLSVFRFLFLLSLLMLLNWELQLTDIDFKRLFEQSVCVLNLLIRCDDVNRVGIFTLYSETIRIHLGGDLWYLCFLLFDRRGKNVRGSLIPYRWPYGIGLKAYLLDQNHLGVLVVYAFLSDSERLPHILYMLVMLLSHLLEHVRSLLVN